MENKSTLGRILEHYCEVAGLSKSKLYVLDRKLDPYAQDTPANHRDGQWLGDVLDQVTSDDGQQIHTRGLHYRLMSSTVFKPNGERYRNTDADYGWLTESAVKAARWLNYVPFTRFDDRKHTAVHVAPTDLLEDQPFGSVRCDLGVDLPSADTIMPRFVLHNWMTQQNYRLVLVSEKTSCEPVMLRFRRSHGCEVIALTGEISDTICYGIAERAYQDGRPCVVGFLADFDPTGFDMSINLGCKLQAFSDLHLPGLDIRVIRIALTHEQVCELNLPSSPLKDKDPRKDAWLRRWGGLEQTEVDSLAALRPDDLAEIIDAHLDPYFDHGLDQRCREDAARFVHQVNEEITARMGPENRRRLHAEASDQLEQMESMIRELEDRMRITPESIGLEIPDYQRPDAAPPVSTGDGEPEAVFDTRWDWLEARLSMCNGKTRGRS